MASRRALARARARRAKEQVSTSRRARPPRRTMLVKTHTAATGSSPCAILSRVRRAPRRQAIICHGTNINREVAVFDRSEAPFRIAAESLLSSQKLIPAATLNKIRIPCRPVESNLITLPTNLDKLPSEEQIIALALTYKFKIEEGAEIKPVVSLLNNRIYVLVVDFQLQIILF